MPTTAVAQHSPTLHKGWDEPAGATTQRGWYWPTTTRRDHTSCAGHYLDYGPDHRRYDDKQTEQPGSILCVVLSLIGTVAASGYCATVEQARQWIEQQAVRFGHARPEQ